MQENPQYSEFQFVWINCLNRFELEFSQQRFLKIIEMSEKDKTLVKFFY